MLLTEQQRTALRNSEAVRIREDGLECVVLRADVYDRVRRLLYDDSNWSDGELRRTLAESAGTNGWNEPEMDAYDNYDEELAKRCQ